MASYDPYEVPARERTKRYYREERDARGTETRDTYLNVTPSRDLVPRPREDSDLSVEEIRRDFPPPGYSNRDVRRARSAEPGYYDEYDRSSHYSSRDRDRDYDRDSERRSSHKKSTAYYEEEKKARVLSKQEQIIAAITGAAIAIGGKELYDRREANQRGADVQRNVLASAALGAAGAFAGYQGTELYNKRKEKGEKTTKTTTQIAHRGRDGRLEYYSEEEETAKEKKGHKNFLESALAAAGLGGAVKALTGGGKDKDDKSDTRSRRGSSRSTSRSRSPSSRSKGGEKGSGANKIQKAAMASLIAGATEAFRISKEPGSWKGEKAKRVLTAAAGAATIDAAQNPDKAGSKLGIAEAVIGGLVGNRVLNGSKKNIEEDEKTGRSRSRSRARSKSRDGSSGGGGVSGLAALATAGLGAFGAKKIMDHRERSRSRRRSADSGDSRDRSPDRRHRSRSRSVVDSARRGLAKVGIGNGPDDDDDDRRNRDRSRDRRRDQDDYDSVRGSRRHGRHHSSDDESDRDRRRGGGKDDDGRSAHGGGRDRSRQRGDRSRRASLSESDLGDSDEDNKRQKKMREGRLSPEEAKKLKKKALLQDAASVGIAALGIKGAISEVKEAREMTHEMHEWKMRKAERHERRLARQLQLSQGRGGGGDGDDEGDGGNGSRGYSRRRADNWSPAAPPRADRSDGGPRYYDGNPYAALPAPPAGQSDRR
ncbi:hypothetical protein B0T24DRAFT_518922 [Lasiosphaeria ovina]|uniref:DUF3824 domain-containing protein n=1 Tax=Lasiosphaeria ovina TaxID=92902 RepID=A0AAE0TY69_9PEZI|nr:hypothetical protein B0T24DRAFT_518922 [Lasiosphaeria ovina]